MQRVHDALRESIWDINVVKLIFCYTSHSKSLYREIPWDPYSSPCALSQDRTLFVFMNRKQGSFEIRIFQLASFCQTKRLPNFFASQWYSLPATSAKIIVPKSTFDDDHLVQSTASDIAISPDNKYIAFSITCCIGVVERKTEKIRTLFHTRYWPKKVDFSPDGKYLLVSGGNYGELLFLSVPDWGLHSQRDDFPLAQFTPDGNLLLMRRNAMACHHYLGERNLTPNKPLVYLKSLTGLGRVYPARSFLFGLQTLDHCDSKSKVVDYDGKILFELPEIYFNGTFAFLRSIPNVVAISPSEKYIAVISERTLFLISIKQKGIVKRTKLVHSPDAAFFFEEHCVLTYSRSKKTISLEFYWDLF